MSSAHPRPRHVLPSLLPSIHHSPLATSAQRLSPMPFLPPPGRGERCWPQVSRHGPPRGDALLGKPLPHTKYSHDMEHKPTEIPWLVYHTAILAVSRDDAAPSTLAASGRLAAPFYTSRSVPEHGNACMAYFVSRLSPSSRSL
ncbi:hypothetical protein J3F83DRAFT_252978 [Trichoderma novae-zelandiae]